MKKLLSVIDWFVPEAAKFERSELSLARNFVFTHLFGPLLSQLIAVFLYRTDPDPGFACWTVIVSTWLFWLLPFMLKYTRNLQITALVSVELLAFTALFGSFCYGGVSSPFLPWMIISLLLGFFYLSDKPLVVIAIFACNITLFYAAYDAYGFPQLVPLSHLESVGWISIVSATVYMSWMAIFYANVMSVRSDVEKETERHRATSRRLHRAKELADEANRSKSIFLAKMSHELRTPLNAVIGYSEILLETFEPDGKNAQKRADLGRINAAGKHLLSLVADVLDLSKIESNSIELKVERFDLAELAQDTVATAQSLAAEHRNTLTLKCIGKLGEVQTDATKLRQIILNLVSNATKFTQNGTVTVTARRDRRAAGDWIEIKVLDSGIGIEPGQIDRLFQNYGQATASISGQYGGTGLGLAISQKFCALMGGTISVSSEPGRGSCFTVRVLAALSAEGDPSPFAPAGGDDPERDLVPGAALA